MEKIIIWGIGQISQVLTFYIQKYTQYKICAYTLDKEYMGDKNEFNGIPVIAFEEIEKHFSPNEYKMALIMGYKNLNRYREEKYLQAKAKGYDFINYISPHSLVETECIGKNVFILGQCHIQPFTEIGNNCILWSDTMIGHHTMISDNCFFAGAKIGGCVKIKRNCFLGNCSMIADGIIIGQHSVIGQSCHILKDVKDYSVFVSKQTKRLDLTSEEIKEIL